jgi:hypothetical protein|tara:strand:- start:33 stop:449 length:417 start_codon:yes stop_codon:yes gene_type:complete
MKEERKIELLLKHFNTGITHDYGRMLCTSTDLNIYPETTRDGYEVFIITHTDGINIAENVFYYEHGLVNEFIDEIVNGQDQIIFVDESIYEDNYFESALLDEFDQYVEQIINNLSSDITEEELKHLKEEYEIEDEDLA